MKRSALVLGFCLALTAPLAAADEAAFFFKDGDRIVMIGDSITEQRLYSNYVEMWCQTRFPSYNLVFRNVGIGGDRSTGGNARFSPVHTSPVCPFFARWHAHCFIVSASEG